MKYILLLFLGVAATARAASAPVTCAQRLAPRDLVLEALDAIGRIPEFGSPIWELPLNSTAATPFILVVGPDSRRKNRAVAALKAAIPGARSYDVYAGNPRGVMLGRQDFLVAAWVEAVPLHILDITLTGTFRPHLWDAYLSAAAELHRLGFDDFEVTSAAGVYLIEP